MHTGCVDFTIKVTFCLHFYLINIDIFDYLDTRLSGLFTEVPTSPDNRGSTVTGICCFLFTAPVFLFKEQYFLFVVYLHFP